MYASIDERQPVGGYSQFINKLVNLLDQARLAGHPELGIFAIPPMDDRMQKETLNIGPYHYIGHNLRWVPSISIENLEENPICCDINFNYIPGNKIDIITQRAAELGINSFEIINDPLSAEIKLYNIDNNTEVNTGIFMLGGVNSAERTATYLEALSGMAQSKGMHFIPMAVQSFEEQYMDMGLESEIQENFGDVVASGFNTATSRANLISRATDHGVHILDLGPGMHTTIQQLDKIDKLPYYTIDPHYTPVGQIANAAVGLIMLRQTYPDIYAKLRNNSIEQ